VSGLNWRVIFVDREASNNTFGLINGTVYTGPFQVKDFVPQATSTPLVEINDSLTSGQLVEYQQLVTELLATDASLKVEVNNVKVYPNVVNDDTFYLVTSTVSSTNVDGSTVFTHHSVFSRENGVIVIKKSLTLA
jgi:hypothetical protein